MNRYECYKQPNLAFNDRINKTLNEISTKYVALELCGESVI